jgi:hypothetical protein
VPEQSLSTNFSDSVDEEAEMKPMGFMPKTPDPFRSINFADDIGQSVPSTCGSTLGQVGSMVLPHPMCQLSQATPPAVNVQKSAHKVCKPSYIFQDSYAFGDSIAPLILS